MGATTLLRTLPTTISRIPKRTLVISSIRPANPLLLERDAVRPSRMGDFARRGLIGFNMMAGREASIDGPTVFD